jgi:hypothetical protein
MANYLSGPWNDPAGEVLVVLVSGIPAAEIQVETE